MCVHESAAQLPAGWMEEVRSCCWIEAVAPRWPRSRDVSAPPGEGVSCTATSAATGEIGGRERERKSVMEVVVEGVLYL